MYYKGCKLSKPFGIQVQWKQIEDGYVLVVDMVERKCVLGGHFERRKGQ
jgi:hypothetical protein